MKTSPIISLLFLMLVSLAFLSACKQQPVEDNKPTWQDTYETRVKHSLDSNVTSKRIFLGYDLGMNREDFDNHTKELVKSGKLVLNTINMEKNPLVDVKIDSANFVYKLPVGKEVFTVALNPIYDNNKLVQLTLTSLPNGNNTISTQTYRELVSMFITKYGYDYLEKNRVFESSEFFWLLGPVQIKLQKTLVDINVSYSDLNWYDRSQESGDVFDTNASNGTVNEDI